MGKSHRDNARARKKIGETAYAKKRKRRTNKPACVICGQHARSQVLLDGVCPRCLGRIHT